MIEQPSKVNVASNFGDFIPIHAYTFQKLYNFTSDTTLTDALQDVFPPLELYRGQAMAQNARLLVSTRMVQKVNGTDGKASVYVRYISSNGREYVLGSCVGSYLQQSVLISTDFVTYDVFNDSRNMGNIVFNASGSALGADANLQFRVAVAFGFVYEK